MNFFIAFLVVGILIGYYFMRLFSVKTKRRNDQKNETWDRQYKELMDLFKKKTK